MTILTSLTNHFGAFHEPCTAAVTLLDILLVFIFAVKVSLARMKYKVDAPATDGPPKFRRIYRVHMNALEQLVLNLPLLWLAALAVSDRFAALAGILWPLGRLLYAYDYGRDPAQRVRGFALSALSHVILFFGAAIGIASSF